MCHSGRLSRCGACRLDPHADMIEAHWRFRHMRRHGWQFGRCLSFAWAKAREQRARATAAPYICGSRHIERATCA